MIKCPKCGKEYENSVKFCNECGTLVQTPPPAASKPQNVNNQLTVKQLIGFMAVCGVLFLALVIYVFTADVSQQTQSDIVTPPPVEKLIEPSQHGTTEYAEYIFYKAVNDSLNATDVQLQEAVAFIKANTNSYFNTQENMEKTMYYGKMIAYKYRHSGNDYEKTGNQAYRTVEYVYRGIDKTTDETTLKNLKKLQEMAVALPDIK